MRFIFSLLLLLSYTHVRGQLDSLYAHTDDIRPYILHTVGDDETLYTITKLYNIDLSSIITMNPSIKETYIQNGQTIKVPIAIGVSPMDSLNILKITQRPIYHIMQAKESLASLKRIYGVSIQTLRIWNELRNDTIPIGRSMIVSWVNKPILATTSPIQIIDTNSELIQLPAVESTKPKPATNTLKEKYQVDLETSIEIKEDGFGKWFKDESNSNPDLCLHATLPKGSIIKLTDFTTGNIRYFKVIGKLPPSGENYNVLIRISEKAAKQMKIFDKKFKCTVSYLL